jgi:ABC-2 type transport system ATP-binding protein
MSTALSMRAVRKAFGDPPAGASGAALRGIDLDAHVGEIVGLVGPAGAGKTTLLLCAAGILHPDAGVVRWFGVGDGGVPGALPVPGVAYVPDQIGYYPFLTVREALEYYATLRDLPLSARAERVVVALRRVALDGRARRRVGELTPGARRRLMLAQAILIRPRLILIDAPREPIGEVARDHLRVILRDLALEGVAIVLAARRPEDLGDVATRVVHLDDGRVLDDVAADHAAREPAPARVAERVVSLAYDSWLPIGASCEALTPLLSPRGPA